MHTTTADLFRNYPVGMTIPALQYARESFCSFRRSRLKETCQLLENQENELGVEFNEVFMRYNHPIRVPVILRVAQTHLRITTVCSLPLPSILSDVGT